MKKCKRYGLFEYVSEPLKKTVNKDNLSSKHIIIKLSNNYEKDRLLFFSLGSLACEFQIFYVLLSVDDPPELNEKLQ